MIAFISGHLDITMKEFSEYYEPRILEAIKNGDGFVVGDARGADFMAQAFLWSYIPNDELNGRVTVYHAYDEPRNHIAIFNRAGGFSSQNAKDKAMTEASDYDIAYIRPGREDSGTARNLKRRTKHS